MASLRFQYDPARDAVGLFTHNHHEGGYLSPGEGALGHPIDAFRRASYGELDGNGTAWRIIPAAPCLSLVT